MRLVSAVREFFEQLSLPLEQQGVVMQTQGPLPPPPIADLSEDEGESEEFENEEGLNAGPAPELVAECRQLLLNLGMESVTELVKVEWNPQLRSTAGYARYPSWQIELNPRLLAFDGQVSRTLRHELAHLVAYHRAGRRRIKPHGPEWQRACSDLGIHGEPAHHRLPLPRNRTERRLAYQCPNCTTVVRRVRPFKRPTACLQCCNKHAGGQFDARFKFVKLNPQACPPVVSA